jgi:hypothetical protein
MTNSTQIVYESHENGEFSESVSVEKKRNTVPFEAEAVDSRVKLGFNYWVENDHIEGPQFVELLSLLVNPALPIPHPFFLDEHEVAELRAMFTCESQGVAEAGHLVVLTMNGLALTQLQEHYDSLQFFPHTTSIPFLSVVRSESSGKVLVGANPNDWFYNDVRTVGETILSPKINLTPLHQCSDRQLGALMQGYQWRFDVSCMQIVFVPRSHVHYSLAADHYWRRSQLAHKSAYHAISRCRTNQRRVQAYL